MRKLIVLIPISSTSQLHVARYAIFCPVVEIHPRVNLFLLQIDEFCAPYCVEQFSTTKISISEFMKYGSAAFLLILLLSLSRVEVH